MLTGTDLVSLLVTLSTKGGRRTRCRVAYHDVVPQAEGPAGAFSLAVVSQIAFRPQPPAADAPPAHLQTRVAATVPVSAWDGHYSGLVWSLKWAQNGLSPVRPQVVMLADVTIKPGHSLLLN